MSNFGLSLEYERRFNVQLLPLPLRVRLFWGGSCSLRDISGVPVLHGGSEARLRRFGILSKKSGHQNAMSCPGGDNYRMIDSSSMTRLVFL